MPETIALGIAAQRQKTNKVLSGTGSSGQDVARIWVLLGSFSGRGPLWDADALLATEVAAISPLTFLLVPFVMSMGGLP